LRNKDIIFFRIARRFFGFCSKKQVKKTQKDTKRHKKTQKDTNRRVKRNIYSFFYFLKKSLPLMSKIEPFFIKTKLIPWDIKLIV
jgi:hypothetical protein